MKIAFQIICILFMSLICVGGSSDADCNNEYKVAIVYSYDYQDVKDNKEIKDKIAFIRESRPNTKIMSVYLNYSKQMAEQRLHENALSAFKKIQAFHPDLTVVYDNVAFEHVAVEYLYPRQYNTVFIDVWKQHYQEHLAACKLGQYGSNATGVLLIGDAPRLKRIMGILDVQNIYLIKNDVRYYSTIASDLTEQLKPYKVETFDVSSTIDLGKTLRILNSRPKGMVIFLMKDITNYNQGGVASVREIANIILALNTKHFEVSYLDNYSKYGIASSDLVSNRPKDKGISAIDAIISERINSKKTGSKEKSNDFIVNVDRVKALQFPVISKNWLCRKFSDLK